MNRIWIGLLLAVASAAPALAQPAEVIMIRHAEKPAEGNELSQQGRERAAALVPFFLETREMLEFKTPVAIYAPLPAHKHSSIRSTQTVAPLAAALHLEVIEKFHKTELDELAKEILSDKRYEGRMVLIAWEHKMIPPMAKAFGVADAPQNWPGEAFDRVWVIKFSSTGSPTFQDIPQRLMFGDSAK